MGAGVCDRTIVPTPYQYDLESNPDIAKASGQWVRFESDVSSQLLSRTP
jgi:hypothetical protein